MELVWWGLLHPGSGQPTLTTSCAVFRYQSFPPKVTPLELKAYYDVRHLTRCLLR